MPEPTIRYCLTSLGFHYPSTLYKTVKRDISAFLRASVDLPCASDELLRHTADRYLTHTQSHQTSASWNSTITKLLHWATEEKRTEKQDLICDVMKLMQRNALETMHKKECTGCRFHPQPNTSASSTTTGAATTSVRQSPLSNMSAPLPWPQSVVERDSIASGLPLPEERLSSHESTRSPHSPSRRSDSISSVLPWTDDPYDPDYTDARPPRKRKRVPATSHVRSSLPQPPAGKREAAAPDVQGTILVAPSPRATATPGLDQQPRRPSEVEDPQPQASKAEDTQQEQQTSVQANDPEEPQQTPVQAKVRQASISPDVLASASAPASTSASSSPSSLELRGRRWVFETAAEKIKGLEAARARQHALLESFVQERGDDNQVKSLATMLSHHSKTLDTWLTETAGRGWEAETLVSVLTRQLDIGEWLLSEICGDDKALLRKRIWELDSLTEKCFVENGGDPVR
ncbi:hypothetical protein G647_07389 [Cladophialophora carrionii CBS 160.54]|uniref:Uncharacterized protein n=1 Tax=Cladophialophora carrionii CBS 160.54 TaxID=1279043 RepID=V9D324_9EURO|nr:uncharacterized protein G647_07389 [Cladophialophora carrionii CBS 160.54]ETI21046.1 hypothetical protein G647_07389 [Cladophialophora carrionii CBS 160.54]